MSFAVELPSAVASSRNRFRLLSYRNASAITAVLDFILILAASLAAGWSYHVAALGYTPDAQGYAGIGCLAAILFLLFAKSQGMYRTSVLLSLRQLRGVVVAWFAVVLAVVLLLFLLKIGASYSRGAIAAFAFLGLGLLTGTRALVSSALRRAVDTGRIAGPRAVTIGQQQELGSHSPSELLRTYGVSEIARFPLPSLEGDDANIVGRLRTAIGFAQANEAELVLLALPWTEAARDTVVRETLRAVPLPVLLLPDRTAASILSKPLLDVGSHTAVELQRAPLSSLELAVKRALDLVVATAALILLSPLLLIVSIAVKLTTRDTIIFRQDRNGFNGRSFEIYKFRTMTVSENGSKVAQAEPNDHRVTDLGHYLRSLSIDELPQLINVLRGEMSIVGPRPHAVVHDDEYSRLIANYAFRSHVKPGITGWAQVNGFRGRTERLELMERRVEMDLYYINNWSIWLDLWILARTCVQIRGSPNAY